MHLEHGPVVIPDARPYSSSIVDQTINNVIEELVATKHLYLDL